MQGELIWAAYPPCSSENQSDKVKCSVEFTLSNTLNDIQQYLLFDALRNSRHMYMRQV